MNRELCRWLFPTAVADRSVCLSQITLLAAALVIAQILVRRKVSIVGDSAVALLLGLIAGIFFFYLDLSATFLAWVGFSKDFFFTALLPPM